LDPEYTVAADQMAKTKMNVPTIQTDIYFLIQRPISTFLIKYYGHKGDTQIVLIKDVNATDMKSSE